MEKWSAQESVATGVMLALGTPRCRAGDYRETDVSCLFAVDSILPSSHCPRTPRRIAFRGCRSALPTRSRALIRPCSHACRAGAKYVESRGFPWGLCESHTTLLIKRQIFGRPDVSDVHNVNLRSCPPINYDWFRVSWITLCSHLNYNRIDFEFNNMILFSFE